MAETTRRTKPVKEKIMPPKVYSSTWEMWSASALVSAIPPTSRFLYMSANVPSSPSMGAAIINAAETQIALPQNFIFFAPMDPTGRSVSGGGVVLVDSIRIMKKAVRAAVAVR